MDLSQAHLGASVADLFQQNLRDQINLERNQTNRMVFVRRIWNNCFFIYKAVFWPRDNEGSLQSSSQATTCPPHTLEASHPRRTSGVVFLPGSHDLSSTRPLVTLLRPWIRRFMMIISLSGFEQAANTVHKN